MAPIRVMFCVTHKNQYNGYALVGYELTKRLAKMSDIDLTIFGFQNFYDQAPGHRVDYPENVTVYDAWKHENPKSAGFGFGEVKDYVLASKPDVVVLYNDLMVVTELLKGLKEARAAGAQFKIITYVDQVYLNQRKDFLAQMDQQCEAIVTFTEYWQRILLEQGVTKPTCYLHHGIDKMSRFPVDKALARRFFNLRDDDWMILNLNRNQPRKRWDICLQAFAEVLTTHRQHPIKLLIGTSVQGAWNLLEIYERELNKRGISMQEGMKHIVLLDNPQRMTDAAINVLYNTADIGVNFSDGEGHGLTCFEQGAIGIPSVVSRVGGHMEFFDDECAIMVTPKMSYYVDASRDAVGGEAQLCDYKDFAAGIIAYFENNALRVEHGRRARQRILTRYPWDRIGDKFAAILRAVHVGSPSVTSIDDDGNVPAPRCPPAKVPSKKKTKKSSKTSVKELKELKSELDTLLLAP
jgi:glycosyltransferase involved in cell wall biosynthesis